MGVFTRPDSPVYWLYLETTKAKEKTAIRIGTTVAQQKDSAKLAEDRYHQRMNELAARLYQLPTAVPAIRFATYAATYRTDTIAHHRGARRERELLKNLVAFFGEDLLTAIDQDRVRAYQTSRSRTAAARTINREVDLLKAMLRDAVPKYLSASPIAGMRRLRAIPPQRRLMTAAEEAKLLAVGDPQDRAILILGRDTLVRLGDLLDLQRRDRRGPWLYIADPKAGAGYEVPLSPRAQRALDAIPGDAPYYFAKFRTGAKPDSWPGSVRQRLALLCRRARLKYGRTHGGITFHWGTRRTGATALLMAQGQPLPVVQQLGGWKTPDVLLKIYSEVSRTDLLKAVGALPPRSRSKRKSA